MMSSPHKKGKDRIRPSISAAAVPHPTTMLGATLCDVLFVTDAIVPLPPMWSPRHSVLERPILIDEEKAKEEEEESSRALKRRRRQEASLYALVDVSSKETPSVEVSNLSSTRVIREAKKSSNHVKASLLDAVELLEVSTGSRSYSNSSSAFTNFTELVLTKLDLLEVHSTREDKSFIYGFSHIVKVRTLVFYSSFLIIIYVFDICSSCRPLFTLARLNALIL